MKVLSEARAGPKPMAVRICRDCRHIENGDRCMRGHPRGQVDLVTGEQHSGKFGYDAYFERGNEWKDCGNGLKEDLCGPGGRFFEPKDPA